MNAQDVRKALLADPRHVTPAIENAIREDAELAALRQQLLNLNGEVAKAFGEVSAPPGLADRIILRVRYRQRSKWMAGIAASFVVAMVSFMMPREEAPSPIAFAMLDHVVDSDDELTDNGNVPVQTAKASLRQLGVGFHDVGYQIRHLGECVVAGRTGRHLVMNTPDGLVSFLILPKRTGEMGGRQTLGRGNFQAVLRPAQQVAIGVFADKRIDTKRMESMMQQMFPDARGEA